MSSHSYQRICLSLLFVLSTLSALGTHPVHRTFDRFDDFLKGEHKGISLTGNGRLIMAPALVEELSTEEAFVYTAAASQTGVIYLGTGNNGRIFRVGDLERTGEWAKLEEPGVYAIAVDSSNRVYAGTGPDGKVYRFDSEGNPSVFFEPKEKYIWDIEIDDENNVYVATGPNGIIYKVDPQGEGNPLWDSEETHVVAMEWDLDRNLIVGTAPNGLIARVSRAGKPFVIYDSSLEEARAIRVDRYGQIFAAALSGGPKRSENSQTTNSSDTSKTEESKVTVAGTEKGSKLEVYRINRQNLVETLYSSNDQLVFDLEVRSDGSVLLATGNRGRLISLSPDGVPKVLIDSPEEQVTKLVTTATKVYALTSNLGKVFSISPEAPKTGTYESEVIDAGMIALWGTIRWRMTGETSGDLVSIFTRSGNTEKPNRTWSDWQGPYTDPEGSQIGSSPARFLQWKLEYSPEARGNTLLSEDNALEDLSISYIQQNAAPRIESLTVHSPGVAFARYNQAPSGGVAPGGPDGAYATSLPKKIRALDTPSVKSPLRTIFMPGTRSFSWKADDPNEDDLIYTISLQMEGSSDWTLVEEDLDKSHYVLDTRSLADGTYRVRIVASDQIGNPPGKGLRHELTSKPFVIANSLPTIRFSETRTNGNDISVPFVVETLASPLYQIEYSIESGSWHLAFPEDGISDQRKEQFTITLENLQTGEHILLVRAVDLVGNIGTAQYRVRIP